MEMGSTNEAKADIALAGLRLWSESHATQVLPQTCGQTRTSSDENNQLISSLVAALNLGHLNGFLCLGTRAKEERIAVVIGERFWTVALKADFPQETDNGVISPHQTPSMLLIS
jgi:hypothetical protein